MGKRYKNFAFISYSHRDIRIAKWLQSRLEKFKLPTEVPNNIDSTSRYLRPVFRDQSDLNTGVLGDELRKYLEQSKFLILICSKSSATSTWVSEEAKAFVEMGRLNHIIPVFLSDGTIQEQELFPEFLRDYFAKYPDRELLGVNVREVGKEKALIRIVSKMLDVSFDSLWKRHQRQKRIKVFSIIISSIFAISSTYLFAVPVFLSVTVYPQKANLPKGDIVNIFVNEGEYSAPINNAQFKKIILPGFSRFRDITITAEAQFFEAVDTLVKTGFGVHRNILIPLERDNSFGRYCGVVFDDDLKPLCGVLVSVEGHCVFTDSLGQFSLSIPLEEQQTELPLLLEFKGYQYNYNGELHSPNSNIKMIMHHKKN